MVIDNDTYSIFAIFIGFLMMVCYIYGNKNIEFRNVIFVGFAIRVLILFADYYDWFFILNSGADTEMFHNVSKKNVELYQEVYRGNYTVYLTYIYRLTNCSRLIAQFINVLLGMGVIFCVQKILRELNVTSKNLFYGTLIVTFLPNLNILSAILLREAWIEFFVALSLLFFVRWFLRGGGLNIVGSIASVLIASTMHAGVIGVILGYTVAFILYNPDSQRVTISKNTIISLIFLAAISAGASSYMGLFTGKFAEYENINDIVEVTNKTNGGGSDYLKWINSNSVAMSLMFAPLKMFYFLFSPLPTEWRGPNDLIGFMVDGGIYMYMFYTMWRNRAAGAINRNFKIFLLTSIMVVTFIFAYGTTNAGTAFRHRNKIVSLVVVAFAISSVKSNEYESKEDEDRNLPES